MSINICDRLKPEHRKWFEGVDLDERTLPSGNVIRFRLLTKKFKAKLPEDLLKIIEMPLRILLDEHYLLRDRFGIDTGLSAYEILKTKRGYTVAWSVRTVGKNNMRKFLERVGFADREKQKKLESYVREWEE